MKLTNFTDYAFRVLLYVAQHDDRRVTINEIVDFYDVSRGHMMKVVHLLATENYLVAVRGRSGGLHLAKHPGKIRLGDVIRLTEPDFKMVECFSVDNECRLAKSCRLPTPMNEALNAFLAVFDGYTLQDMRLKPSAFLTPAPNTSRPRGPKIVRARVTP